MTSARELVSVIIPTFNREQTVARAISSALNQGYVPTEVIVVDDGSTDETRETLAKFGGAIRVIHQANAGAAAARNTGSRAANGEYLAFLDSDDEWLPEKLERQIPLMREREVVLSGTNWRGRSESTPRPGFDSLPFQCQWICDSPAALVSRPGGHRIQLSSWVVRRDVFERLGGFDPSFVVAEDNFLIFRLAFCGRFALTKEVLVIRDTAEDGVKLTRPGDLDYQRKVARAMCAAAGYGRALAFNEPKRVQRLFAKMYSHYLRQEMELAALDEQTWAARRRALEVLVHWPAPRDFVVACIGIISPSLLEARTRRKYSLS